MSDLCRHSAPRTDVYRVPVLRHWLNRIAVVVLLCTMLAGLGLYGRQSQPLRIGVSLPKEINMLGLPTIAEGVSAESLVTLGPDGRVLPQLAKTWQFKSGGYELHFNLFQNIRLHDGRPIDAPVIAALMRRATTTEAVLQFHPRLKDFYEIRAADSTRLVLRSKTARILAIEELADVTLKTGAPDGGLGPFVVDALDAEGMKLRGFRAYYKGAPALDTVEFNVYRSQRAAWTGMMRGEIDALYEVTREAIEFVEKESRVRTYSFLRPYVATLAFNVTKPALRDAAIRKAISLAIDRGALVKSAYRGRARVATGPLAPEHWSLGHMEQVAIPDLDASFSILASRPLSNSPDQMPARLRFRCLVPTFETQPLERIALALQRQLFTAGVDLQLEHVSLRDLVTRLHRGDFESVLMEFYAATPSWLSSFWHSRPAGTPTLIRSGYSAADRELDAMDSAATEQELRDALAAVYRKMAQDPPAIFIAWPEVTRAVSTRFEVPVEKGRDIMGANLWLWRPARVQ